MSNEQRLGATFSIDTTDLKAGLAQANRLIRESESEFKKAAAGMEDWTSSSDGLRAKINSLNKITDLQKAKVNALSEQYEKLIKKGTDPLSKEAVDLRIKINNETAALNKNEKELKQQKIALDKLEKSTSEYTKETGKASKETKSLGDSSGKASKGLQAAATIGKTAAVAIAAVAAAAGAAVTGFLNLAESTREYREDMNKLQSGFQTAGFTAEQATEVYKDFFSVLGEEDRSVEAVNHLAKLCDTQEDLNKWTTIATGVWATFGDSLPIEGLTEAANETAKTGDLTGVLADALNWAGISEDEFQKKLDACNSESERAALITETLNGLYDDAADKYKELNGDVMDAQRAQSELTDAIAQLGAIAEPIMTTLKLLVADLVKEITPFVELIGKGMQGALEGNAEAAETLAEGLGGLLDTVLDKLVGLLPSIIDVLTALIPQVVSSILDATPKVVEAAVSIVDSVLAALSEMLPLILNKIVEIVPTLISRLVEAIPSLLESAVQLLSALVDAVPIVIDKLLYALPNVINAIIQTLIESIPIVIDAAIKLLMSIVDALPTIIDSMQKNLPRLINSIINGLLDALPIVLNAAVELLMAIVEAIPEILPALVTAIPKIILTIQSTLLSNLPKIISTAFELFFGIIKAIPQIQGELIRSIPSIISTIIDTLVSAIPEMINVGKDLLGGLVNGLVDGWNAIKQKVVDLGNSIVNTFKNTFGIHSPSRVMRDEIGKNLALGIGEGFEDNITGVKKAMVKSLDGMTSGMNDINLNGNSGLATQSSGQQIVVNQYNTYSQAHSRYELFKTKQQTAAAVRLAVGGSTK